MGGLVAPRPVRRAALPVRPDVHGDRRALPEPRSQSADRRNRAHIVERVVQERADVGIAWDGDADRCFHRRHRRDSWRLHHRPPGRAFPHEVSADRRSCTDLRASHAVRDVVTRMGGTAIMNRVGHSFIKNDDARADAIFGGEVTGTITSATSSTRTRLVPALLLLELMSNKGQALAELAPLKAKHSSRPINLRSPASTWSAAKFDEPSKQYHIRTVEHLDGRVVEFDDWHFNVRPSNTEPLLRLNLERPRRPMAETRRGVGIYQGLRAWAAVGRRNPGVRGVARGGLWPRSSLFLRSTECAHFVRAWTMWRSALMQ